jgi:hypothetical protein
VPGPRSAGPYRLFPEFDGNEDAESAGRSTVEQDPDGGARRGARGGGFGLGMLGAERHRNLGRRHRNLGRLAHRRVRSPYRAAAWRSRPGR